MKITAVKSDGKCLNMTVQAENEAEQALLDLAHDSYGKAVTVQQGSVTPEASEVTTTTLVTLNLRG